MITFVEPATNKIPEGYIISKILEELLDDLSKGRMIDDMEVRRIIAINNPIR
jgi:hypothetical protein